MAETAASQGSTRGGRGGRVPRAEANADASANAAPVEYEPRALFVAGFAAGTDAQEVGTLFSKYGEVEHVRLSARGVGRVVFQSEDAISKSLALNATDYNGNKLRVEQHRRSRYPRSRGRGRGRGRGRAPRAEGEPRAPRQPRQPRAEGETRPRQPPRQPRAPRADAPPAELKPVDPTRVFLGRLPYSLEDAELNEIFGSFGLKSLERSRNHLFAFATFNSAGEAAKAVEAKPTLKSGRAIRVEAENPNIRLTRPPRAPRTPRAPRDPAAPRAPRVRKERAPIDPALLDKKRVFIGYLPENVAPENVKSAFAGVVDVQLRGKYGYVSFDTEANAAAAIAKHESPVFGGAQNVKVEIANRLPRPPRKQAAESSA